MPKAEWEKFEEDVQNLLGLDATICSGNKFYDQGDAVDRSHPNKKCWRMMVDCKYTEKNSFPVTAKFMGGMVDKATELGLRFALAVRLRPPVPTPAPRRLGAQGEARHRRGAGSPRTCVAEHDATLWSICRFGNRP
jgi:hypothetical protein